MKKDFDPRTKYIALHIALYLLFLLLIPCLILTMMVIIVPTEGRSFLALRIALYVIAGLALHSVLKHYASRLRPDLFWIFLCILIILFIGLPVGYAIVLLRP